MRRVDQITKTCYYCVIFPLDNVYLLEKKTWILLSANTTIIFMWIHGSGQAEIFDLEDEQTNIRRDESTLPMQTLCFISFISAGAQRPLAARSGLTRYRH